MIVVIRLYLWIYSVLFNDKAHINNEYDGFLMKKHYIFLLIFKQC